MQSMPKRFTHECKHQTQSQDAEAGQDGKPIPDGPHSSTFSRARGKLDIFAMLARQWEWRQDGFESRWISLCDWLQTEGLVVVSAMLSYPFWCVDSMWIATSTYWSQSQHISTYDSLMSGHSSWPTKVTTPRDKHENSSSVKNLQQSYLA